MSDRVGISVARSAGPIHLSGPRESKNKTFIYILPALARMLTVASAFMAFDALQSLHVIQLLFCINLVASCIHFALQQPFSSGKALNVNLMTRVATHAVFETLAFMLFLYAIPLCGAVRSVLIFYIEDIVIAAALAAVFSADSPNTQANATASGGKSEGSTARKRGAFCLVLAVIVLLFFDNESHYLEPATLHAHMQHHQGLHQLLHLATISVGLPDHRGGIGVLLVAVILKFLTRMSQRKLVMDVGGPKRLRTLSSICSTAMLVPLAAVVTLFRATPSVHVPFLYTVAAVIVFSLASVADFYCSQFALMKMEDTVCARLLGWVTLWTTLVIGWLWVSPVLDLPMLREHHVFSGGILIAFVFLIYATWLLTSPQRVRSGNFMGYDAQGVPHWRAESMMMGGMSQLHDGMPGLALAGRRALRQIIDDTESRRIFYYLCLNLGFTGVEFVYGIYTNSLGLLSDSFHMLFDSSALVVGLYASVISKSKNTRMYPYGFARFELLSGYINGLFLCVIAFYIVTEAISRFITPPEVKTEKLLLVSFLGLCVNMVGLFVFGHHHHGGGGGEGCEHSHGGHDHAHGAGGGHVHSEANRLGLYLHVLADTLGSVGVIVSSLLIQYFGWTRADPICSFAIASLIVASVIPLLKQSGSTLVLRTPESVEPQISQAIERVMRLPNVLGVSNVHFWRQSDDMLIGSLHVMVKADADEQLAAAEIVAVFKATTQIKAGNLCVQIEKEEFVQRKSGLRREFAPSLMMKASVDVGGSGDSVSSLRKPPGRHDLTWVSPTSAPANGYSSAQQLYAEPGSTKHSFY